jgi:hypothetical protein
MPGNRPDAVLPLLGTTLTAPERTPYICGFAAQMSICCSCGILDGVNRLHPLAITSGDNRAMYRWFRSLVSLRGIAALAIGCMFIVLAVVPEAFGDNDPPWIIKVLMVGAGVLMVAGGSLAIRFKLHRQRVVGTNVPQDVMVELEDGGGEGSADTAFVELDGGCWAVPFDGPAAAWRSGIEGKVPAKAWFDPATDMPVAVEVRGVLLNTLAAPQRRS